MANNYIRKIYGIGTTPEYTITVDIPAYCYTYTPDPRLEIHCIEATPGGGNLACTHTIVFFEPYEVCVPASTETITIPAQETVSTLVGWDSGGESIEVLNGDGRVIFQVDEGSIGVVVGLTPPEKVSGYHYSGIDDGLYFHNGTVQVMENGSIKTAAVGFDTSDVFTILRQGNAVSYLHNTTVLYTGEVTAQLLQVDCSLYASGDAIYNIDIAPIYEGGAVTFDGAGTLTVDSLHCQFLGSGSLEVGLIGVSGVFNGWATFDGAGTLDVTDPGYLSGARYSTATFDGAGTLDASPLLEGADADLTLPSYHIFASSEAAYAASDGFMPPLVGNGGGGWVDPLPNTATGYTVSTVLTSFGVGVTGQVVEAAEDAATTMLPMISRGSEGNYGESIVSLEPLSGDGGSYYVPDSWLVKSTPTFTIAASGTAGAASTLYADVPSLTFSGVGGARVVADTPSFAISASGTADNLGRLEEDTPGFAITASGTQEILGVAEVETPPFELSANGGGYVILDTPGFSVSASGTAEILGVLAEAVPLFTIDASGTVEVRGGLVADIPAIESLWGILRDDTPAFAVVAEGYGPAATVFYGYAMNMANGSVTRYTTQHYDHVIRFLGNYYGVTSNSIDLLGADSDGGTNIDAAFTVAENEYEIPYDKRAPYVYVNGRFSDQMTVAPIVDGTTGLACDTVSVTTARVRRAKTPRAYRGTNWSFRITNTNGADFELDRIEIPFQPLKRKV